MAVVEKYCIVVDIFDIVGADNENCIAPAVDQFVVDVICEVLASVIDVNDMDVC